jgi:DNA gyrase subunit A
LLAMMVARADSFVFTATDGGFAKRTPIEEYPVQGRGGQGVLTAKLTDDRGGLVGALIVDPGDEIFAITSGGGVIRTRSDEVRPTSRATMGVRLINLGDGDAVVGITRNAEAASEVADDNGEDGEILDEGDTGGIELDAQSDAQASGTAEESDGHNGVDGNMTARQPAASTGADTVDAESPDADQGDS